MDKPTAMLPGYPLASNSAPCQSPAHQKAELPEPKIGEILSATFDPIREGRLCSPIDFLQLCVALLHCHC